MFNAFLILMLGITCLWIAASNKDLETRNNCLTKNNEFDRRYRHTFFTGEYEYIQGELYCIANNGNRYTR